MAGLSIQEISKIINRYIGVSGGYLGDFSYRTHAEFYPEYCDLEINPYSIEGTTRERFMTILKTSSPDTQAKIIRGILERFPVEAENKPATRTQELYSEIHELSKRLDGLSPIPTPEPKTTSAVVERAIYDVETLLQTHDAISGVDRIHTALHGYLQVVCDKGNIAYVKDEAMLVINVARTILHYLNAKFN